MRGAATFHLNSNRQELIARLHELADNFPNDSIAVIFPSRRNSCWKLAGQLRNRYEVLEDADCITLAKACAILDRYIHNGDGIELLNQIISMFRDYAGKLPQQLERWRIQIGNGGRCPRTTNTVLSPIIDSMLLVRNQPGVVPLRCLFSSIDSQSGIIFKSKEMWVTLDKAMTLSGGDTGMTLEQAVKILRQRNRLSGRRPPHRCVSTTLLLKGMEFDHVVIADYSEYRGLPRHLYVAISRAKQSLEIFKMATPTTID